MLKKISFKFGQGNSRLECSPGVVTVFVGPNNSGKSLALAELHQVIQAGTSANRRRIIRKLKVVLPRERALRAQFVDAIVKDFGSWADKLPVGPSSPPASQQQSQAPKTSGDLKQAEGMVKFFTVLLPSLQLVQWRNQKKINLKKLFPAKAGEGAASQPTDEEVQNLFKEALIRHEKGELSALIQEHIKKGSIRLEPYLELLKPYTIALGGTARLGLVSPTHAPRWRGRDDNRLVNLLKDSSRLRVLRGIVHSEFQLYPVIDTTQEGKTELKLARKPPGTYERSTTPEALRYFDKAKPIEEFSDGMRAFIGLLAAVLSQDHRLIIIDEPEAFLHPPLARRLGSELCKLARRHGGQVFTSTHSPDFLMGCVQTGNAVSIVRLTYKNRKPTARELSPDKLREMMRNPLLRSTGVLGALFHEGAIICESDSDRAFYQEINERLVAVNKGHRACTFLNAQNKQTINRIVGPLREMGIPAAAIVDLDVISKGDELSRLLDAAQVGKNFKETMRAAKDRFFDCFMSKFSQDKDETKKRMKQQGVQLLSPIEQRELRLALLDPLAQHGIFVVPNGELEAWLPQVAQGIGKSDKASWLTKVFERMGEDPEDSSYVKPSTGDVWSFMEEVASWIGNPQSGLPSEG